jgi:hypothetical protein
LPIGIHASGCANSFSGMHIRSKNLLGKKTFTISLTGWLGIDYRHSCSLAWVLGTQDWVRSATVSSQGSVVQVIRTSINTLKYERSPTTIFGRPLLHTVQFKITSTRSEIRHHSRLPPSPEEPAGEAATEPPHTMTLIFPSLLLMVLVAILLQLMIRR